MQVKTFCRICSGMCGLNVSVEDNRIVDVKPDRENKGSRGYICIKGQQYPEMHHGPKRLRHCMKKTADGKHENIESEKAIQEVGDRLRDIIDRYGSQAVAAYYGTGNIGNPLLAVMAGAFMKAIGSPNMFSTMTIDQSAKWVTQGRLGMWAGGRPDFNQADVWLICGANPLVSLIHQSLGMSPLDPVKQLKEAKKRGLKLIVIDPVRNQTAKQADLFIQPLPGEDTTIFAGLIKHILDMGWHDKAFCDQHVAGLEELRKAIEPFTLDYVSHRAGVPRQQIEQAAILFARDNKRGMAAGGTGPNMAKFSNLAEQLIETLNVVCGRFPRAGDVVHNVGVLAPAIPKVAQVIPPLRSWENGLKHRMGDYGTLYDTRMTGLLADEILMPGEGQIRALFCVGGNPAGALPDQIKAEKALRSLDLLVAAEPRMTQTARLADYVFAPTMHLERPGDTTFLEGWTPLGSNFAAYSPALIKPEADMDVIDDWYLYWALAKHLGLQLELSPWPEAYGLPPLAIDMENRPTSQELLDLIATYSQIPYEEVKKYPGGTIFEREPSVVHAPETDSGARFQLAPPDVLDEIDQVVAAPPASSHQYLMTCRRVRDLMNTADPKLSEINKRLPYNPAYMHSDDLAALGIDEGSRIEISSARTSITAIVKTDDAVRPGVISMTHGFGGLPSENLNYEEHGASTNILVSTDQDIQSINAMPLMSAIPVTIRVAG